MANKTSKTSNFLKYIINPNAKIADEADILLTSKVNWNQPIDQAIKQPTFISGDPRSFADDNTKFFEELAKIWGFQNIYLPKYEKDSENGLEKNNRRYDFIVLRKLSRFVVNPAFLLDALLHTVQIALECAYYSLRPENRIGKIFYDVAACILGAALWVPIYAARKVVFEPIARIQDMLVGSSISLGMSIVISKSNPEKYKGASRVGSIIVGGVFGTISSLLLLGLQAALIIPLTAIAGLEIVGGAVMGWIAALETAQAAPVLAVVPAGVKSTAAIIDNMGYTDGVADDDTLTDTPTDTRTDTRKNSDFNIFRTCYNFYKSVTHHTSTLRSTNTSPKSINLTTLNNVNSSVNDKYILQYKLDLVSEKLFRLEQTLNFFKNNKFKNNKSVISIESLEKDQTRLINERNNITATYGSISVDSRAPNNSILNNKIRLK